MPSPKPTVKLDGPIFEPDVVRRFQREIGEGIQEVGAEGEGILMGFISKAGFEESDRFLRSVDSEKKSKSGDIDASSVTVTDDWAHMGAGRPTKTWFEEGRRANVRLRKGGWGFKNSAARLRTFDYESMFRARITRALG